MNISIKILLGLSALLTAVSTYATASRLSFTETTNNILEPLVVFTEVIHKINLVVGGAFVMAAFLKYKAYRNNPSQVPISRPVILLILGLTLLSIPFIADLPPTRAAISGTVSLPRYS